MTDEQFQALKKYLELNYTDIYKQYAPYSFNLSDSGLTTTHPADVDDETQNKLDKIIKEWCDLNKAN